MEEIGPFKIIGISVKTTNENGKGSIDLGKLWERFFNENIEDKINNRSGEGIYSIYTDYESDYKGYYTAIIGLKVDSLDDIPNGFTGRQFDGGTYKKFVAKGKIPDTVAASWKEIWEKDNELNRRYTADFEVYGPKSQNGESSEVDIFIAVK